MDIILAKSAGFCFGVSNAIKILDCAIEKNSGKIYTLGEIIHNSQVVDYYKKKGVLIASDVKDIEKDSSVVIRAHGVSPSVLDSLKEKELNIFDATCPFVKKIQELVSSKYKEGYKIIIFGNKNHPEVIGINGYCDNTACIIENKDQIFDLDINTDKVCVVSQTTQKREVLQEVFEFIDKKFKNAIKFDTICNATTKRQEEAKDISKIVDLMIVLGGVNSSNTQKLYEVAKQYCSNTLKVYDANQIKIEDLEKIKKIGITAGASTPDWVIKEVLLKMEELEKEELDFKSLFEESLVTLHTGDVVEGVVIGVNEKEVYVDLGYKSDGIIPKDYYSIDPEFKISENVKIGDKVKVFVINVNDRDGNVLLSKVRVEQDKFKKDLVDYFNNKTVFDVKIVEVVRGGVVALYNGVRIFIPASKLGSGYVKDLESYLNKTVSVRIIEVDKRRGKIIASARDVIKEAREKELNEFWSGIQIGKRICGTVKNFTNYGAFVDVGAIDGFIHISELSWDKVKKVSDVLGIGQKVEAEVLDFNKDEKKLSLSIKKCTENPKDVFIRNHKIGDIVDCKIIKFLNFGAFAEIEKGIEGLIHISEISDYKLNSPKEVLKLSQQVKAKIVNISEDKKIALSIKAVEPINPAKKVEEEKLKEQEDKEEKEHIEEFENTIGDMLKNN